MVATSFLKGKFHNPLFFEKLYLVCLVRACVREYLYCIVDSISWMCVWEESFDLCNSWIYI